MRGDLYNGWMTLAGDFMPTLNKEDDPTKLKVNESPDCYGVNCDTPGRLAAGTIPTGTARIAPTKSVHGQTYNWYLNRLWRVISSNILTWGSPWYDDKLLLQGVGKHQFDANIVTFMPCLEDALWVATASGSYLLNFAKDNRGFFNMNKLSQEMTVSDANNALTLNGMPIASNANGVFMYDGRQVKELTAKVRNSLGNFSNKAITANYTKGWVVGTNSFVVDTLSGNLYDYGTSGFRFTSRTLTASSGNSPFIVGRIGFVLEHTDSADGTISWQTKVEDNDWEDQEDIDCSAIQGYMSRVDTMMNSDPTNCHRFALRITALPSNIRIKEIQAEVTGLMLGDISE